MRTILNILLSCKLPVAAWHNTTTDIIPAQNVERRQRPGHGARRGRGRVRRDQAARPQVSNLSMTTCPHTHLQQGGQKAGWGRAAQHLRGHGADEEGHDDLAECGEDPV